MISVIICTYRRPGYLRRTLECLGKMKTAGFEWEVLVIDNAGCAETAGVVAGVSDRFPSIRRVVEARAGVAFARNCGWREAGGEILAYLDDDCLVEPDWLDRIHVFFTEGPGIDKNTGLVGGRILLLFEMEHPAWLSAKLLPYLSQLDWGTDVEKLNGTERWIGEGNSAVRRSVIELAGGFPESLGRRKGSLLGHEGNAAREVLEKMGYTTWYNGMQTVRHIVFEERITSKQWLRRRVFWGGVSEALCHRRAGVVQQKGRLLLSIRHMRLVCSFAGLRALLALESEAKALESQCDALFKMGYAAGLLWRC